MDHLLKSEFYQPVKQQSTVPIGWFEVTNPATEATIGYAKDLKSETCKIAINEAHQAFTSLEWKKLTANNRQTLLRQWADLVYKNSEELAKIVTLENGKTLNQSGNEAGSAIEAIRWAADEGVRAYGETIPASQPDEFIYTIKQAVGVVGVITPWNFPLAMVTKSVSAAIAAGCTVVLKPSPDTPLIAIALVNLFYQAGFPKNTLKLITSSIDSTPSVGYELATNTRVRKLAFTGSTQVGKLLLKDMASSVKGVCMELGGNSPLILFEDGDIDTAIQITLSYKTNNAGQVCIGPNRFFVHKNVLDTFVYKLRNAIQGLNVGNGFDMNSDVGPLINDRGVKKIESLIQDAISKGAKVEIGGQRKFGSGHFFQPTLITGMNRSMRMTMEEIFGPVIAVFSFETDEEVVQLANDTEYGLASYFFTKDLRRTIVVSQQLETGLVSVNGGCIISPSAPFGGYKQSGLGREGGKNTVEEYMETKTIGVHL